MQAGLLIADRFLIQSLLGKGGMGSVWLAHHTQLDVPCAVKFIEGPSALDADLRRRFTQEAKAAALLRSPHVVQIFDAGTWEGRPYLAMELLEGEELSKRLDRVGRLGLGECLAVAEQVARALAKAHAAGVVHRDLKPDNIFLVRDDEGRELVKILDFGIAKRTNVNLESLSKNASTKHGAFLGTPYYMSPEQTRDSRSVDFRADLWSLGVIVFECLTGRRPFQSEVLTDLLLKIGVDPLPVPSELAPDLPPAFDAWWQRAAERDPDKRFASAREMVDALSVALGVSGAAERVSAPEAPSRPAAASARSAAPARSAPEGRGGPFASTTQAGSLALATSPRSETPARPRSRLSPVALALASIAALGGAGFFASRALRHDAKGERQPGASAPAVSPEPPRPSAAPPEAKGPAEARPAGEAARPVVSAVEPPPRPPASAPAVVRPRVERERPVKKKGQGGDDHELGF
ncbi:MAG TPA: protein kinase [Polyangiaceae bacterium]|nr:protein kinase [Polyangiaceae bacterium]